MKTLKAGATTRLYYFKKATFMAFTTKVITDTSPDFSDNPQVITESGQPASVEVDNLTPNTAHWTKAEIWQDGVLNDTSGVETFNTLQAGVITLEYIQTVRSGYGYDVVYRYTSTYAPSSAVLATNGTQFQGFIDSAQNTVSFWVTGLTAGTAYLTNVTMYDIYAESVTVTGSIVTTVVNEVRITNTTPSETSVECELDYVIDSGFYEGYVEYWLATQDPATEQAEGHFYFNNGDTSVTADGLTAGTAYLFRATLLLGDGTTEIHSSVVSASTTAIEYFRITNETSSANTIAMYYKGNDISSKRTVEYSTDEGITWNSRTRSGSGSSQPIIYVELKSKGKSILVRGDYSYNSTTGNNYVYILPTANYSVSGNLFTLTRNSVIQAGNKASITSAGEFEFDRLFEDSDKLIDASNLTINNITSVGYSSFLWTFRGCDALKGAPNFSSVKNVGEKGFYYAFYRCNQLSTLNFDRVEMVGDNGFEYAFGGCHKITSTPDFRNLVNVGNNAFCGAFSNCKSLTTPANLSSVTSIGDYGCQSMYHGCTSLTTGSDLSSVTSIGNNGCGNMYYGCTSLTTPSDLSSVTSIGNYGCQYMYYSCTSLTEAITPNISTWDTNQFGGWLYNTAATGVVRKPAGLTIPTDSESGVPTGWTTQDYD